MIRRAFNLILLAAMLVVAVVTYGLKRQAEGAADEVARLEREIADERDNLAILRAEWSMLTQPGRLQAVVDQYAEHFRLQPFSPDQIATLGEIPLRPLGREDGVGDLLAKMAASEPGKIE